MYTQAIVLDEFPFFNFLIFTQVESMEKKMPFAVPGRKDFGRSVRRVFSRLPTINGNRAPSQT